MGKNRRNPKGENQNNDKKGQERRDRIITPSNSFHHYYKDVQSVVPKEEYDALVKVRT